MKHRYELPLYSFYDHTGMVRHLEKMARRGWRLEKMDGALWRYQPMEPQRLKYALVYFPEVTGFEPKPPEGYLRLQELCAQAGWLLAANAGKFQIYYNQDPDAVELETDPGTQVEVIHRTMKRNFIPSYLLLALAAVMQLFMQIGDLNKDYSVWYSGKAYYFSGFSWMMLPAWSILLLFYLLELGRYFHWYRRAKARAEKGLPTPSPASWWVQLLAIIVLVLLLGSWFLGGQMTGFLLAIFGIILLTLVLAAGLSKLLKATGVSAGVNQLVTISAACILALVSVMGVSNFVIQNSHREETQDVVLPLRLEDLGLDSPGDTLRADTRRSPLLQRSEYRQSAKLGSVTSELEYIVVDVYFRPLWDSCLADFLKEGAQTVDAAPWDAEQAWQVKDRYGSEDVVYVLCWDDRMVYLELDVELTDAQKAAAAQKLKP